MDRAFSSGSSASPPAAPGSPSIGYPTSGNSGTGTPATKPGPYWYHMITEEIRGVLVAAGLTPSQGDVTQLLQALRASGVFQTQPTNDSGTKVATTAFANPGSSLAGNGWQKLPSGLIIQWGLTASVTITNSQAATNAALPIAFPNNFFKVIGSAEGSQASISASIVKSGLTLVSGVINNTSGTSYTGSMAYVAFGN